MTTLDDAVAQMMEFGLEVEIPVADGNIKKCVFQQENRSKKSGWYVLHQMGDLFTGKYGSWKDGEGHKITRRNGDALESDYSKQMRINMRKEAEDRQKKKKETQRLAAIRANEVWESCTDEGSSPYLERKGCLAHGTRFHGKTLVIPMGREGQMRSLQSISASGFKKFMGGGEASGCYFIIKGSGKLAICEGFATGSTIHQATGWSVAVCFSASNLIKVAPYFKRKDCVVCGDNDEAGLRYAELAAKELDCKMFIPPNIGDDFNDMTIEEVKKCLT